MAQFGNIDREHFARAQSSDRMGKIRAFTAASRRDIQRRDVRVPLRMVLVGMFWCQDIQILGVRRKIVPRRTCAKRFGNGCARLETPVSKIILSMVIRRPARRSLEVGIRVSDRRCVPKALRPNYGNDENCAAMSRCPDFEGARAPPRRWGLAAPPPHLTRSTSPGIFLPVLRQLPELVQ